jgi:hypothetical protein
MTHRLFDKYPLTLWSIQAGILSGLFVGLLMDSLLLGSAMFILFAVVGCTWRRDEAPIVPFMLGYQWCAITVGYWYFVFTGIFPTAYALGDLERTVRLSLTGLVLLAAGIRVVRDSLMRDEPEAPPPLKIARLSRLFWFVIVIYGIDYVRAFNTKSFGGLDIPLTILLEFRYVLLMVLWYETIRRGADRRYLWLSLVWVFVPSLGSYFSDFKTPLILLLLVSLQFWQPWDTKSWKWSLAAWTRTVGLAIVALFLMLVWQAGVKRETRKIYDEGLVNGRLDRAELFVQQVAAAVPEVIDDPRPSIEILISRLSYIGFFSRVLEYVPAVEPHAGGELLKMAVTNAFMPRLLFPSKPVLPSDSFYTRRFTGIMVAEEGTSISIGYMAEFYADWGLEGMFVSIFLYGCLIGACIEMLRRFVQPSILVNPFLITIVMAVYQFEHQFIKTFAALISTTVAALIIQRLFRKTFLKTFGVMPLNVEEPAPQEPVAPTRRYRTVPRSPRGRTLPHG